MRTIGNEFLLKSAVIIFFLSSCVPAQKLDDMSARKTKCEENLSTARAENLELTTKNTELTNNVTELTKEKNSLMNDTSQNGIAYRRLVSVHHELSDSYDKLLSNNDKLLSGKSDEAKKALSELGKTQEELFKKEDELKKKEKELNDLSVQLKEREGRVSELQNILDKKDSTVKALKETVSKALTGFTGSGLTVTMKNGKVYVSLEERLLFATGSTVVDKKGEEALKELGKVLEKNTDINVLIEGHTDNVPISGGAIKDNWDLSVLRATSVVRILTKSSEINPIRLTPAGKGEYMPVDAGNSVEARKKNRRIEVILTPKLDELFQAIESN
ncbi:MAG TPA: OmpA family protein [Bacteroidia bacterium]|nr:OmpA family protein [Bacteroidia bacterium]